MNTTPRMMFGGTKSPLPLFNNNYTEDEARRVLVSPAGQKVLREALDEMYDKIKADATKAVTKVWNDRLCQAEDYVGLLGLISNMKAIEMEIEARKDPSYEAEYKEKDADGNWHTVKYSPRGWKKTHLSLPEIVSAVTRWQSDAAEKMGGPTTPLKDHYEKFINQFGEPLEFDSYKLNTELDLKEYDFVDDDSPFGYMTAWEIYEEGLRIGDHGSCMLATIVDALVLIEHPTMKKLLGWFMQKRNERLRQFQTKEEIDKAVDYLRSKKVEIPTEWQKDFEKMLKFNELRIVREEDADEQTKDDDR